MKVESRIKLYEVDGNDTCAMKETQEMVVTSHWNTGTMVNLVAGGHIYTVAVAELRRALDAAQKAHPW